MCAWQRGRWPCALPNQDAAQCFTRASAPDGAKPEETLQGLPEKSRFRLNKSKELAKNAPDHFSAVVFVVSIYLFRGRFIRPPDLILDAATVHQNAGKSVPCGLGSFADRCQHSLTPRGSGFLKMRLKRAK